MPPKAMTRKEFVKKAREVHGNRYDYSKVNYVNSRTKVVVICPKHGPFEIKPANHLQGIGCRKCANESRKLTTEAFIEKAKKVHGNKYDYSKMKYVDAKTKVTIICPEHGEFKQTPASHLMGVGCPLCGREKTINKRKVTLDQFIKRAKKVHGDRYDYSKVTFSTVDDRVTIICPEHGEFEQRVMDHLRGHGCWRCAVKRNSKRQMKTREEFIAQAVEIHGGRYDYSQVVYKGKSEKVTVICPIHGPWEVTPDNHVNSRSGCPKCAVRHTQFEEDVFAFLQSILGSVARRACRDIIPPYELDIYIPEARLAVECNGNYWHSYGFEDYVNGEIDRNYHLLKTELCEARDIQLIHIFEHEWKNKPEIVKSMLKAKLGIIDDKVYARTCKIVQLTAKDFSRFLNQNHISGSQPARYRYGLLFDEELVAVMGISKCRYSKYLELVRYATKLNTVVVGGFSKLFTYVKNLLPKGTKVVAYADRRFSSRLDNVYIKNGFKFSHVTKPNYFYCKCGTNIEVFSRIEFQKHKLASKLNNYDPSKTEMWNVLANGYRVFFDCGNLVYVTTI